MTGVRQMPPGKQIALTPEWFPAKYLGLPPSLAEPAPVAQVCSYSIQQDVAERPIGREGPRAL